MSKAAMNLQDSFLNQVRRENAEVKVLLVNGTVLRGIVKGFDNFTLILNNRNGQHLVYKHAIAQLVSHRPQGQRPHGEEHGGAGESGDHSEHTEQHDHQFDTEHPAEAVTADSKPAPAPQREKAHAGGGGGDNRQQKPRKEGFNTLDLSSVKLGGEAKK